MASPAGLSASLRRGRKGACCHGRLKVSWGDRRGTACCPQGGVCEALGAL